MASIFKRPLYADIPPGAEIIESRGRRVARWTDDEGKAHTAPVNRTGRKIIIGETEEYYIAYSERPRLRKIVRGCVNLKATETIARKLEDEAHQRRRGVIDAKAEKLAAGEAAPLMAVNGDEIIGGHLADFIATMRGKGDTGHHIQRTANCIRKLLDACGFAKPADLDAAKVSAYVAELKRLGKSARSINATLTAIKGFSHWLTRTERMRTDPMMQVAKLNAKADRQRIRRALSDDELTRLIAAAQQGPAWTWRKGNGKTGGAYRLETLSLGGPDRAMLYRLAAETGLRAGELASLTPGGFDLADLDAATVGVLAAYSKHRRDDVVPLRADLAQAVAAFIEGKPADARLFAMPERTADVLKADLEAARQAWLNEAQTAQERKKREESAFCAFRDSSGRVADFHALRHTFITRLARSGVAPSVAKSLARHSTITLTMDHYTHTVIGDERAALDRLPTLTPTPTVPALESAKATGTDGRAESSDSLIARLIARSGSLTPTGANTGDDSLVGMEAGEHGKTPIKTGDCEHLQSPAANGPSRIRTLDQWIMSPLL